ncbi:MAG: hypothetical protein RL172_2689 [Bacteroidota bacterium]|jgi:uncharacterized membrane protein
MKKKIFTGLLACSIGALSCKHDIPLLPPAGTDAVCFENDVLPIFQTNCAKAGCHDAATHEEGYRLDTYNHIIAKGITPGNAGNSKIYKVIITTDAGDIMPPPPHAPLTNQQKNLVATWINEGAQNTTNCAGNSCDSTLYTYNAVIKPILQTHCLGCHSGTAADGGFIKLDTYSHVKEQADLNTLYPSVAHTSSYPMPKNAAKLSDCKIAVIRRWIEAGAPNN